MSQTRISQSKANGALHAPQAAGTVPERHGDQRKSPPAARQRHDDKRSQLAPSKLAPFAGEPIEPIHGQMWPLHSVAWFHPELKPRRPDPGDLSIESHRKVAAPGFLCPEVTPADQAHTSDEVCDPLPPALKRQIPQSGLDPSGWDARVMALPASASPGNGNAARSEERGTR